MQASQLSAKCRLDSGFLFTTGGTATAITDAVKLTGAGSSGAVKYADITHGPLA